LDRILTNSSERARLDRLGRALSRLVDGRGLRVDGFEGWLMVGIGWWEVGDRAVSMRMRGGRKGWDGV